MGLQYFWSKTDQILTTKSSERLILRPHNVKRPQFKTKSDCVEVFRKKQQTRPTPQHKPKPSSRIDQMEFRKRNAFEGKRFYNIFGPNLTMGVLHPRPILCLFAHFSQKLKEFNNVETI